MKCFQRWSWVIILVSVLFTPIACNSTPEKSSPPPAAGSYVPPQASGPSAAVVPVTAPAQKASGTQREPNILFGESQKISVLPKSVIEFFKERLNNYSYSNSILVSPQARKVVYPENGFYFVNGERIGRKYQEVGLPVLSQEGENFWFRASKDKKQFIVRNGIERSGFDQIFVPEADAERHVQLDSKGENFLYKACDLLDKENPRNLSKKCFVVSSAAEKDQVVPLPSWVEDEKQISQLGYVPFSDRFYYILIEPKTRSPLLFFSNEKIENSIPVLDGPYFGADGKISFYLGAIGNKYIFVLDGKAKASEYEEMHCSTATPVFGAWICLGLRDGQWYFLNNGEEKEKMEGEMPSHRGTYSYAPNNLIKNLLETFRQRSNLGQPFYYRFSETQELGGPRSIVIQDKRFGPFYVVENPIFSSDGKHFAFYAAKKDGDRSESFYVIDGKTEPKYSDTRNFKFSPDSQHSAYLAQSEKSKNQRKTFLVRDGKSSEIDKEISPGEAMPYFSPNSTQLILWLTCTRYVKCPNSQFADQLCYLPISNFSVDNRFEAMGNFALLDQEPRFSPDGKKMAYLAVKDGELWWIVQKL